MPLIRHWSVNASFIITLQAGAAAFTLMGPAIPPSSTAALKTIALIRAEVVCMAIMPTSPTVLSPTTTQQEAINGVTTDMQEPFIATVTPTLPIALWLTILRRNIPQVSIAALAATTQ